MEESMEDAAARFAALAADVAALIKLETEAGFITAHAKILDAIKVGAAIAESIEAAGVIQ